jgi:hypothetical protein
LGLRALQLMGLERCALEREFGRKSTDLRARQRGRAHLERANNALQRTPRRRLRGEKSAQRRSRPDRGSGAQRAIEVEREAARQAGNNYGERQPASARTSETLSCQNASRATAAGSTAAPGGWEHASRRGANCAASGARASRAGGDDLASGSAPRRVNSSAASRTGRSNLGGQAADPAGADYGRFCLARSADGPTRPAGSCSPPR